MVHSPDLGQDGSGALYAERHGELNGSGARTAHAAVGHVRLGGQHGASRIVQYLLFFRSILVVNLSLI
jgi:hypothetical protein